MLGWLGEALAASSTRRGGDHPARRYAVHRLDPGALCCALAAPGAGVVGVDASPKLIELARRRTNVGGPRFVVWDARELGALDLPAHAFDVATCGMALGNIDPNAPVLRGAAALLRPRGALVIVVSHPAFRAVRQSSWA